MYVSSRHHWPDSVKDRNWRRNDAIISPEEIQAMEPLAITIARKTATFAPKITASA